MSRRFLKIAACMAAAMLVLPASSAWAQSAVITLPDVSQHARVSQRIGLTDITIDYHRPLTAGRKIFGALVPYGEVWRAGADLNTTFDVSDSVSVEGHALAKGVYGLHMIPGPGSWTVIFSRNSTSWGSFTYDSTEDALRVQVTPRSSPAQDVLTYSFDDPTPTSVVATLRWADVAVPVRITVDVPHLVAANLRLQLRGRSQTEWAAWEEAANYFLENHLDAHEALSDAQQSVGIEDRFENEVTLARAFDAVGQTADAAKARAKAVSMGTQAQVYGFARALQRLGQQQLAMQIFAADTARFPGTWTSHLEATRLFVSAGNYDKAIAELARSIALAPAGMKQPLGDVMVELQNHVDINR